MVPQHFIIPLDDKFLVYAPLNKMAIIGNKALINEINSYLKDKNNCNRSQIINWLNESGFFKNDLSLIPDCDCVKPFLPTQCVLMPTTACNLNCIYCYADNSSKTNKSVPWSLAKKAIEIAFNNSKINKEAKFSLSFHGGGEPTLNRKLFLKASNYSRKLSPECKISITSNCFWDDDYRKEILDIVNEISVSFDGNKITQNNQRPGPLNSESFSKVMKAIREIELKNIDYGIRLTVTKQSVLSLDKNIKFLCEYTNCKTFQVEAVYKQGRALKNNLEIDNPQIFIDQFLKSYYIAKEHNRTLHFSSVRPQLLTNSFCKAPYNTLILTSDGLLSACYEVFDKTHTLANKFLIGYLDETKGIQLYDNTRKELIEHIDTLKNNCENCFCYYHCAGDCPTKSFIEPPNKNRFRCIVTKEITKEIILDCLSDNGHLHLASSNPSC